MEVQFEVVSRLEKKHFVQWYQHVLRKRIIWVVLFGIIGMISLVLGITTVDFGNILYACLCGIYVVWNYRRPWIMAKRVMKSDLAFYGSEIVETVTTFSDVIQDTAADRSNTVPYDKIQEISILKDLIVLKDVKSASLLMDKNGFTKGDFQSFMAFIGEKCPQLKLPKW